MFLENTFAKNKTHVLCESRYLAGRVIHRELLEPISKMHFTLKVCVTSLLKRLIRQSTLADCAFSSACALPLNANHYF